MKYIFEDKKDDILSKLLCRAYSEEVSSNFIFAGGNGRIKSVLEGLLSTGDEYIFIFLDTIPANDSIRRLYRDLSRICKKSERCIVFPIVCSEYYFIKFLYDIQFPVNDLDALKFCVDKTFYKSSSLLDTEESVLFAKNFEKFYKLVLKHVNVLNSCLEKSDNYIKFLSCDCICDNELDKCYSLSLLKNAVGYISKFPCFPSGSYLDELVLTKDEIVQEHRNLVDGFNAWSDRCSSLDSSRDSDDYFNISYIF